MTPEQQEADRLMREAQTLTGEDDPRWYPTWWALTTLVARSKEADPESALIAAKARFKKIFAKAPKGEWNED